MKSAFLIILLLFAGSPKEDFLSGQKKYERVKTAIRDKQELITAELKKKKLQLDDFSMLIAAYKSEGILEVYVKKKTETTYVLLSSYEICSHSGTYGPKRQAGDRQVPEGFYYIDRFNPASNYYLSLGVSYPNQSDKLKSKVKDLGGDIFIHGSCVTIGCLPMTDDKIKEIYLYATHARNNGQSKIPVYIFPFRMNDENMKKWSIAHDDDPELLSFWKNMRTGYDRFGKEKKELKITVVSNGDYQYD